MDGGIRTWLALLSASLLVLVTGFCYRLWLILPDGHRNHSVHQSRDQSYQAHMVTVLGSGGHTAEIISILRDIDPTRYFTRTYIASSGDSFACQKAWELERDIQNKVRHLPEVTGTIRTLEKDSNKTKQPERHDDSSLDNEIVILDPSPPDAYHHVTGSWHFHTVPRARKVHQPLYTTPFSALWSFIGCLRTLHQASGSTRRYPDVIVSNGPATAVMVVYAALFLKFFGLAPLESMKVIYIESWARVGSLSLSGRILLQTQVCNKFVVQWDKLRNMLERRGYRVDNAGYLVE